MDQFEMSDAIKEENKDFKKISKNSKERVKSKNK